MAAAAGPVDPVGQAAGLGAGAAVAAALAHHGTHLALTGVAHAQCAVGKNLDLGGTAGADLAYLIAGQLAGQHHPLQSQRGGLVGSAQGEQAHLGAGVERYVRHDLTGQGQQTPVLHQYGVHAHITGLAQRLCRLFQLAVRQQGVQRQKDPHASQMAVRHCRSEFLIGEVFGTAPRVKGAEAHIYRVRAGLDGGNEGVEAAGGGEELHHPLRFCWDCSLRRSSAASFLARLASSR